MAIIKVILAIEPNTKVLFIAVMRTPGMSLAIVGSFNTILIFLNTAQRQGDHAKGARFVVMLLAI